MQFFAEGLPRSILVPARGRIWKESEGYRPESRVAGQDRPFVGRRRPLLRFHPPEHANGGEEVTSLGLFAGRRCERWGGGRGRRRDWIRVRRRGVGRFIRRGIEQRPRSHPGGIRRRSRSPAAEFPGEAHWRWRLVLGGFGGLDGSVEIKGRLDGAAGDGFLRHWRTGRGGCGHPRGSPIRPPAQPNSRSPSRTDHTVHTVHKSA